LTSLEISVSQSKRNIIASLIIDFLFMKDIGRSWNIYRRYNSATSSTNSTPVDLFGLKPDDFEFLCVLDRGSFSQVLLAHQGLEEKCRGQTERDAAHHGGGQGFVQQSTSALPRFSAPRLFSGGGET
jgi:hypothetical protein